jgi:ribosomal-protein-alanine N-acetyltransferase
MSATDPDTVFTTLRLKVRKWQPHESEAIQRIWGDPEVMRYLLTTTPVDEQTADLLLSRFLERYRDFPGLGNWSVVEKASSEIIGHVCIWPTQDHNERELGYHIIRDRWGMGYATEAARGAIRYAFDELELDRIVASVHPDNLASQRVLEKCCFSQIGSYTFKGKDQLKYELRKGSQITSS